MSTAIGRSVVGYKVNKSGGLAIKGDTVINDTTNDNAFTTTTSAAYTGGVWIADETIANNATGRVILEGHATLVNVSASVTRGHTGATHTVAKQTASTGATTRIAGTFCRFTTGGTTPEADIWPVDLLGSSLTNPMSAVGDIIQGTTAGAPAALAAPLTGKVLTGAGVTTSVAYKYPPGYELDYVEVTSSPTATATSEATASTIITGSAVTYDGSTIVLIEMFCPWVQNPVGVDLFVVLYDGSSSIGKISLGNSPDATNFIRPNAFNASRRLTPSAAAHTYSMRAYVTSGTATFGCGAGGSGNYMPAFLRITKISGGA